MDQTVFQKHLLGIEGMLPQTAEMYLNTAEEFFEVSRRPIRKVPALRGKSVINLFYESSTRTRTSFELAGKRLSADVVNISVASSSVSKGETLIDTIKTLEAMQPDLLVVRHAASGAAQLISENVRCGVINAGDGQHEHPTQALLDAFAIRRAKGTLSGLKVGVVGDILHSRVARSTTRLLHTMGSEVRWIGPKTLMPIDCRDFPASIYHKLEEGLQDLDVVIALRIQSERLNGALLPSLREYSKTFGISEKKLGAAKNDVVVMHPGPMNRGVEIDGDLADGKRSLVLNQVEAGVAVRMSVLFHLCGEHEA